MHPSHAGDQRENGRRQPDFAALTRRETQVLALLASGQPNRSLARQLGISERTVRAHITSLTRKLGIPTRIEAALLAFQYRDTLSAP
ncbi:LuxR C-terminal-related transcriptional regulator [Streptomyces carpaticus]|uniref:Two-component system, NarL family, nitrate/nitrite response regulator NarL n=2 Tax=Streptomyces TaxID=1883 RepID=A0A1I6QQW8_9ACTN|nr:MULTISPECIES: LuxR C-terminal-related transcriptional regulator [Streptomyces]QKV67940.1 response regulator transcription factor [Streptomyces harbinensis]UWM48234.1 LuxR C-terminal-related transcriptional regulator [Streptomyces carpaticus]SFS54891.1 two-component system, NarL family, nitrate/nitrite response regulator NarL [Streptomyces harbinensis]